MRDSLQKEIELWKEVPPLAQQQVLINLLYKIKEENKPASYMSNISQLERDLGLRGTSACELDAHNVDLNIAYEAAYKILVLITAGETV